MSAVSQVREIASVSGEGVGPCQYKDKWPHDLADHREGSPQGRREDTPKRPRAKYFRRTVIPNHVKHCANRGARDWWIYTWQRGDPSRVTRIPYVCNSWRCEGDCQRHEAAVAFARTKEAFETIPEYSPRRVGFFVLTIDREGYYSGEPWANEQEAYAAISRNARRFLKRLNRRADKEGVEAVHSRWVSTVEAHKSGWPHYQLMLYLPIEWADELRGEGVESALWSWLCDTAQECGWGRRSSFEAARGADAVAGYLIKSAGQHDSTVGEIAKLCQPAGQHDSTVGEVAKLCQLPTNAPPRFRRLRSGKGFLPPRRKNPEVTGTLVRRQWCDDGTPQVEPLHEIHDPEIRDVAAECCYREEHIWRVEAGRAKLLTAARAVWPELAPQIETPLVTTWGLDPCRGPPRGAA